MEMGWFGDMARIFRVCEETVTMLIIQRAGAAAEG